MFICWKDQSNTWRGGVLCYVSPEAPVCRLYNISIVPCMVLLVLKSHFYQWCRCKVISYKDHFVQKHRSHLVQGFFVRGGTRIFTYTPWGVISYNVLYMRIFVYFYTVIRAISMFQYFRQVYDIEKQTTNFLSKQIITIGWT